MNDFRLRHDAAAFRLGDSVSTGGKRRMIRRVGRSEPPFRGGFQQFTPSNLTSFEAGQ
jgi:hypothetical protein